MSTFVLCVGCGEPLYGFSSCRLCTCEWCGNDLLDGFCSLCDSKNSCIYDPNPNSFDCPPDSYHPPHPIYETYSCDSCGNDSHFGYDCPPQFPLNYESEPGYIENYNSYPYDSSSFLQQYLCCENCGGPHENFQCQPVNQNFYEPNMCYNYISFDFDQFQPPQFPFIHQPPQEISIQEMKDLKQRYLDEMKSLINSEYHDEIKIDELKGNFNRMSIEINKKEKLQQLEHVANLSTYPSKHFDSFCYADDDDKDYTVVIAPDFLITDSLIMENEHLDTIPETESDEFIKSSVENLVLIPSDDDESIHEEVIHEMNFKTYSNPLFDLDEEIISSEFNSIHNEDLDSTLKNNRFDTKSYLIESLLSCDTLMASYPKFDSLLEEFSGELAHTDLIPPGINEANCDPKEDIPLVERLFDPFMKEIDLFLASDGSIPPGIDSDYSDSERDNLFLERLLHDDPILLPYILDFSNFIIKKDKSKQNRTKSRANGKHGKVRNQARQSQSPVKTVGNKMHKAFPLPIIEFPLAEELPTASEESCHCQKKSKATAVKIALLSKSDNNIRRSLINSFQQVVSELGKFKQWQFRIQQYLQHEHYALWEVIKFRDSYEVSESTTTTNTTSGETGKKSKRTVTLTAEDMQKKKNDVKAITTLLLSLPDEHQLRFSKYKTARELWATILKTFGGNEATKKTKKNLLKQQYGSFKAEGSKPLEKTFNRLQVIVAKHRSGNKYGNTACVPTASTNVPTASASVATISQDTACAYIASQSSGSQIKFEDINQIDEDDMKEMDIKWNMALLSMRADKFWKKTGKKISIQGSDVAGFDKSKVECFNCHKMGHFARECRAPRSQERGRRDNYKQGSKAEEHASKALMAIDGVGWDWSYMANDEEDHALVADEVAPTEFALMANTSAESKVFDNSLCSKDCKKNNDSLNRLAQVESRLVEYKEREVKYCEKIKTLEFKNGSNNECIEILKKRIETLKQEKEGVDGKLAGLLTASKNLDNLIESQRSDKNKDGLAYNAVPPHPTQLYSSPKKDLSWTSLLEFVDDTVTDYSRPSPTVESTSRDDQNRNPSVSETVATPITPKPFIKFVKPKDSQSKSKTDETETPKKSPVKYAEQYRKPNKKPNVRGNQRNLNNLKSQQLGPDFVIKKKACFNCGNFNHLAYDCRKRVKKSFTPKPVAHRPYRPSVRTVRTNMNGARPNKTTFNKQAHSYANRSFQRISTVISQYRAPWVPTVNRNFPPVNRKFSTGSRNFPTANRKFPTASRKFPAGSTKCSTADMGMNGKAVKPQLVGFGILHRTYLTKDSGCSRHMTGNISYLSDFEPFDGGYVSFGQGGCNTGKETIKTGILEFENVYFVKDLKYNLFSVSQICDNKNSVLFTDSECIVLGRDFKLLDDANILLRFPRQHNMYSIDLNNIVPHGDLTFLVAKASADECMLWHRRLEREAA
nr:ribonuclease H-like domain-containing protein [Tanacetum cinerariifolium]